jgi:quercetin dioxygenase-like cupin family protein
MLHTHLKDIKEREILPGYRARFVHSDTMTVAHWNIEAHHDMPEHAHPHEQIFNLLEGTFKLTVAGETVVAEPGTVVIIPANVKHAGTSLSNCRVIDVFYPVRTDYQ